MSTIAFWESFAEEHPELQENVNVGVARPNIDHGRLLTLQRREQFAKVTAEVKSVYGSTAQISNRALLSPRRIYREYIEQFADVTAGDTPSSRKSIAGFSANVADLIYGLLRDWRDEGYPADTSGFTARVASWTVTLKVGE
jgi:hypothetical protein